MIRLRLDGRDLSRVRFALSPLWETITSLRALMTPHESGALRPWRRAVQSRLERSDVDLVLLTSIVRPAGYIPDFLVPSPPRGRSTIGAGLAQVAAADPSEVEVQLAHLAKHSLAQAGQGRTARVASTRALASSPRETIRRIVDQLECYWQVALAPFWPRVEALLHADLAYRLDQLAAGGAQQLFRALHPLVSFDGDEVRIVKYYDGRAEAGGRGLLLVPSVFAWPDVIVLTAEPHTPTLTYSPRGLGRLWEREFPAHTAALAEVLGRTRAALLAQLDLPMSTTQLAEQLDVTAPTVNAHLKALTAAGILVAHRDGRAVLYARSTLGEHLQAGAFPQTR